MKGNEGRGRLRPRRESIEDVMQIFGCRSYQAMKRIAGRRREDWCSDKAPPLGKTLQIFIHL